MQFYSFAKIIKKMKPRCKDYYGIGFPINARRMGNLLTNKKHLYHIVLVFFKYVSVSRNQTYQFLGIGDATTVTARITTASSAFQLVTDDTRRRHSNRNIRACSTDPLLALHLLCQGSRVFLSRSRGSGSVEIPPQRSGDRGSRGTPPGTRIEHLVSATLVRG